MAYADVDAETLFDRLRPEALCGAEWVEVFRQPRLTMSHKTVAFEVALLRVEYEVDLPFADTLALMRPEGLFDARRPTFDLGLHACGVERFFAPGDAICWRQPILSTKSRSLGISCAAVVGDAQAATHKIRDVVRERWILRRGFPSPDHCALIGAPFCDETGVLQDESGVRRAMAICLRRHPDDPERCTAATEIRLLRRVPDWSMQHMAKHYFQVNEWVASYKASALYEELKTAPSSYVVVGLSRLTRGQPLLPKESTKNEGGSVEGLTVDSEWEDSHARCADYVRSFLHRIGVEVEVFDTLDGQYLVYYQAALRRGDWDRARAALDAGPWRAHGAAYRRKHGSKTEPKLGILRAEPRFVDRRVVASDGRVRTPAHAMQATDAATQPNKDDNLPVVGTFVHFREPPGLKLPRSNSNPEFDIVT